MSQNYWSPFRDWNRQISGIQKDFGSLKTTEALLGIETYFGKGYITQEEWRLKTTEALLGIETKKVI